jgi:hypothetical protein
VLLCLLRDEEGVAAPVLRSLGVQPAAAREVVRGEPAAAQRLATSPVAPCTIDPAQQSVCRANEVDPFQERLRHAAGAAGDLMLDEGLRHEVQAFFAELEQGGLPDPLREVMRRADRAAQCFNHEHIGTEHLLLGLIEENGLAMRALSATRIDPGKVRREVERALAESPPLLAGGQPTMTPRSRKVLAYAAEEASWMGHDHAGTPHLLLGLLREHEGVAAQALRRLGASLEWARDVVFGLLRNPV